MIPPIYPPLPVIPPIILVITLKHCHGIRQMTWALHVLNHAGLTVPRHAHRRICATSLLVPSMASLWLLTIRDLQLGQNMTSLWVLTILLYLGHVTLPVALRTGPTAWASKSQVHGIWDDGDLEYQRRRLVWEKQFWHQRSVQPPELRGCLHGSRLLFCVLEFVVFPITFRKKRNKNQ